MHPIIAAWDDHEVTNDTWRKGAENHQEEEGEFIERRNRAYRAYFEWMPDPPTSASARTPTGSTAGFASATSPTSTCSTRASTATSSCRIKTDQARHDPERTITGDAADGVVKEGLGRESHAVAR